MLENIVYHMIQESKFESQVSIKSALNFGFFEEATTGMKVLNNICKVSLLVGMLILPQSVWALTPTDLWRPDGQINIAGKWVFYVGPKQIPYKVFLQQRKVESLSGSYILTGYMLNPQGQRFNFSEGELNHGATGNAVFLMELYEGKSAWKCNLDKSSKRPGMWWKGEVRHVQTNKFQATFLAHKL